MLESKTEKLLKKLAQENPRIREIEEILPNAASRFGPSALALTRSQAANQFLKGILQKRPLLALKPEHQKEVWDSLKYILYGAPRKTIQELTKIDVLPPGETTLRYGGKIGARFGEHEGIAGTYVLDSAKALIAPIKKGSGAQYQYTLPEVAIHEIGAHNIISRIAKRLGFKEEKIPFSEPLAEFIGRESAARQGIPYRYPARASSNPDPVYAEKMGGLIEKIGSKAENPFLAVKKFLKELK